MAKRLAIDDVLGLMLPAHPAAGVSAPQWEEGITVERCENWNTGFVQGQTVWLTNGQVFRFICQDLSLPPADLSFAVE